MAQRRMFSKSVVYSSKFLRLPDTCRLLYYDLGMNADDDGYCEWYPVLQMTGAKEQDLQILHSGGFIFIFDKDILIVIDWKENNYIRSDRYQQSKYLNKYEDMVRLPVGIPTVDKVETQVRLGKVRLGKDNSYTQEFEKFWIAYPNKKDKKRAQILWLRINPDDNLINQIMSALEKQKQTFAWKKENGRYIPMPATWLGNERWTDEVDAPADLDGKFISKDGRKWDDQITANNWDEYQDELKREKEGTK